MPLLEETKYMPSHKYMPGPELKEHAERIAHHWGLSERVLLTAKTSLHAMQPTSFQREARIMPEVGKSLMCDPRLSPDAEEEWTLKILSRAWAFTGLAHCTPSDFPREGLRLNPDQAILAARFSIRGEGIRSFVKKIKDWRDQGQLVGLDVSPR